MFACECYPNHEICKNQYNCELKIGLNQKLRQLYGQITYELSKLKSLKVRKEKYYEILSEIRNGIYTENININGQLQEVPKINVLGEYIIKPEHVQVGLNYNDIILDIQEQEDLIRTLRLEEHNILKILKNRADKYD